MLTLQEIMDGLRDRRINVISEATGVSRSTISRIRQGKNANPTFGVMKALSDYLTGGQ